MAESSVLTRIPLAVGTNAGGQEGEKPNHIAFIIDGNRRWARARGLPTSAGHTQGLMTLREVDGLLSRWGVEWRSYYIFSTANWRRSEPEVAHLMEEFRKLVSDFSDDSHNVRHRLHLVGQLEDHRMSVELRSIIAESNVCARKALPLIDNTVLFLNYGASYETDPRSLRGGGGCIDHVPPIDLLVRTGGEKRLSGFLLPQMAYSELYFTSTSWPEFDESALLEALDDYTGRQRRYGGGT